MHSLISWFTRNGVAANLLMCGIVFWGLFSLNNRLPLEVFPSFELDSITVRVPFRGASPTEVEESAKSKKQYKIWSVLNQLHLLQAKGSVQYV